jgi:hypothetical protein
MAADRVDLVFKGAGKVIRILAFSGSLGFQYALRNASAQEVLDHLDDGVEDPTSLSTVDTKIPSPLVESK